MKKYLKGILIGLLTFSVGCQEDFVAPTTDPSSLYIITGYGTTSPIVQINGTESFADLSSGVLSRTWTFPGGEVTDIATSEDANVAVTFYQIGTHTVTLNHTFADNPWNWVDSTRSSSTTLDSTIMVTVVDSVRASLSAFYVNDDGTDGSALDLSSGTVNQLPAGELIRFKQSSGGAPNTFRYQAAGASPSMVLINDADSVVDIKYKRLGFYDLAFEASRPKPVGADELVLEDFLEVVPSTKPVDIERIGRYSAESIYIAFSRVMASPSASEISNFTVRALNTVRNDLGIPSAFDEELPIVDISLGQGEEDNYIILHLGDQVYNSDRILVSYDGGSISTADGVDLLAFDEEELAFDIDNLAGAFGDMEGAFEEEWRTDEVLLTTPESFVHELANYSSERAHSGMQSLKLESFGSPDDNSRTGCEAIVRANYLGDPEYADVNDFAIAIEDETTYRSTFWMYVESYDVPGTVGTNSLQEFSHWYWQKSGKVYTFEIRDPSDDKASQTQNGWVEGQWVQVQGDFINSSGPGMMAVYFRTIGRITMYIDDLVVQKLEVRPFPG